MALPDVIQRGTSGNSLFEFLDRYADPAAIPHDVWHQGRRCLLDLVCVAAAGSTTELSRIISGHAAKHFAAGPGSHPASVLFSHQKHNASAVGAALANGMTIDSFDAHDGHPLTKGHAGCGLFPALLALAETREPDMRLDTFMAALICGYEIAIRCGIALHQGEADYHTSGAWVAVGIAASGGLMAGLDTNQIRHAMGIAEYHGPRSPMMRVIDHPTMLKDGSGWGAMAGVSAIDLAGAGFTGAPALTVEGSPVSELWSDLGSRWRMLEQYFKPWPVCRWAQPAVQAAINLKHQHGFHANQIASVTVSTFHEAVRLGTKPPSTTEEAQYALGFPLACALVSGNVAPENITGSGLSAPTILGVLEKIVLKEDEAFNAAFPAKRYADVKISLADGTTYSSGKVAALGDATMPLEDSALLEKFDGLMLSSGYGERRHDLEQMIFHQDLSLSSVLDLIELVR